MQPLSPRRAFWEALATTALPSVLVWGILVYWLHSIWSPSEGAWGLYAFALVCSAIPMLFFFPIYDRYRKGINRSAQSHSPHYHLIAGLLCTFAFLFYFADGWQAEGWRRYSRLVVSLIWPLLAIENFVKWQTAKKRQTIPEDNVSTNG